MPAEAAAAAPVLHVFPHPVLNCPQITPPVTFMLAAAAVAAPTAVPCFLPVRNSLCDVYGCGGGLHVTSINAPQLLEIYCRYFILTHDLSAIAKFIVVKIDNLAKCAFVDDVNAVLVDLFSRLLLSPRHHRVCDYHVLDLVAGRSESHGPRSCRSSDQLGLGRPATVRYLRLIVGRA